MIENVPRVSVVIPIYNVEKYLEECLDSVLAQTMPDIEVICVNDGSTDSSPEIIKRYADADERIVVIDKPNGGYGHSVNRGIEKASGEWLSIVEPDDIIEPRMYEELLALAKCSDGHDADVVKGSYWLYFHFEDRNPYVQRPNLMNAMPQGFCEIDIHENPEIMKHHPSVWSAIYRRAFIEEKGIRMIEPKGAGWADNPWFFDTMLAAKRIVWTPAPYYKYRQTNPEASSKLGDYHLPFDRLRDIRAIYEKNDIDDPQLLASLYQRSFDYICTTVLEEFRFPEGDPELRALIQEVFDSFDEEILFDKKYKIPANLLKYYRDFMGEFLQEVDEKPEAGNPFISYVTPMYSDRQGLWETIKSLRSQTYENFEVILIDCNSPDRSLEIAEGVAQRDKRFKVIKGCETVCEGFKAGLDAACGTYVHFIRPGVSFEDHRVVRDIANGINSLDHQPNVVLFRTSYPTTRIIPPKAKFNAIAIKTANVECDAALINRPTIFTRLYRKGFLVENDLCVDDERDVDGWGFSIRAICAADEVALVRASDVGTGTHDYSEQCAMSDENDLIEDALGRYDAMAQAAERVGTPVAWRIARCCIIHDMSMDIGRIGLYRSGKNYFNALSDVFHNRYGIYSSPWSDYANFLDFAILEEAFSLTYEDYAKMHLINQRNAIMGLSGHRDALLGRIRKIEKSGSYLLGTSVATAAKAVVPKKARRVVVDAGVDLKAKIKSKKG